MNHESESSGLRSIKSYCGSAHPSQDLETIVEGELDNELDESMD